MSGPVLALLLAIGLFVGVCIGAIGIGGVLLVPSLTYVGGMTIHTAIASAMVGYFFSGLVGAVEFSRQGSIRWNDAGWLAGGAMPGAFIGAAAVNAVPGVILEVLIASLIICSAVNTLRGAAADGGDARVLGKGALVVIGLVAGIGSSMSGTGGPLVLIPILLWLHVPVLAAVGLSQVIQMPISAFATAGNIVYGSIDVIVAAGISALLMIGVWFGALIAHRVPGRVMKRVVSVALLGVGVMMIARAVSHAIGGAGT